MDIITKLADKNRGYADERPVTAVFLGDSVTHGCFESNRSNSGAISDRMDAQAVYHRRLQLRINTIFPYAPLAVINAGIGGHSAPQGLARLERDVLSFKPDLCVVCFGLNDACAGPGGLSRYTGALEGIFAGLKQAGVETLFLTPNMMNTRVADDVCVNLIDIAKMTADIQNGGGMDEYMEGARQVCAAAGVAVCDGYARWKRLAAAGADTTMLLANRINHPTPEMHELFSDLLLDALLS